MTGAGVLIVPTIALTDRFCSTAKPIKGRTDYFDKTVQGLALRVTDHGHRSWCFHYRSPRDGKRARATIGTYPATSLAAARGLALEAKGHVEAGNDPRIVLAGQASAGMTVASLVDSYLADPEKAALRSKPEIERRLRRNVVPVIGAVKLSELRRRDVRNVTDPMLRRGVKIEANRVFEDVRTMIRWAVQNEYLEANPLDGVQKPAEAVVGDRVLSEDEIRILWEVLSTALASVQYQRIVKLCLITAQRIGEVCGMLPTELDLRGREWRLPGSRTKNGHAHVVPLSNLALEIIKEAMDDAGKDRAIFPSASPVNVGNVIRRANVANRFGFPSWSPHDLRRTALTEMARLGIAPIVLGHVANHRTTTRSGVTLSVYSQYTYDKEKRAALDLWADRLAAIVKSRAVPKLRGYTMRDPTKLRILLARETARIKEILGPRYVITKKRGRGRPEKVTAMKGPLVLTLDEMMEEYRQKGLTERQARKCAFADAKAELKKEDPDGHLLSEGRRRSLTSETFDRYYRAGVRELRDSEMWLAKEIDTIIANHGSEAVPQYDPCGLGGITWRRYRRGKRALAAAKAKTGKIID